MAHTNNIITIDCNKNKLLFNRANLFFLAFVFIYFTEFKLNDYILERKMTRNCTRHRKKCNRASHLDEETLSNFCSSKGNEGDIGVCGIGQFFMRYFGNFNFKLRYCGVLRICGMRYLWRFGQRYLIKKKLFYTVSDPLTFVRDSYHSQAIRKSMPSKLSSYRDHNGNAFI